MRARNIKPGFFSNEVLGTLDPIVCLTFAGLWCLADKHGILEDRPLRIKAELFPYRDGLDVNGYLTVLERLGFIARYQVDGAGYIEVLNFRKHQTPHHTEKPKGYPSKPLIEKAHRYDTVKEQLHDGESQVPERSDSLIHRFSDSPIPKQALDAPSHLDPPGQPMPALVPPPMPTTGTEAGRACRLMRQAGCVTVNPGHPDLLDALAAGVTPEALADTVTEAIQAGKTKPFQWAIATARGRLEEAGRRLAAPGHQRPRVVLGLADQVMQTYHDNQRRKLAHERND